MDTLIIELSEIKTTVVSAPGDDGTLILEVVQEDQDAGTTQEFESPDTP